MPDATFIESNFFKNYQNIIINKGLGMTLDNYEVELIFVLHPKMERFSKQVAEKLNVRVENVSHIAKILTEATVLITDYSSIAWDIVYTHNPVIFFSLIKIIFLKLKVVTSA